MSDTFTSHFSFSEQLKQAEFHPETFPHWICRNFLPEALLKPLASRFPTSQAIHGVTRPNTPYTQNTAYPWEFTSLPADLKELNTVASAWTVEKQDLIQFIHPHLPPHLQPHLQELIDHTESRGDARATSPCTTEGTTQLGPHCDNPKELLAGLIYLRDDRDQGEGGALDIYALRNPNRTRYMSAKRRIPSRYLTKIRSIPYASNTAIFFVPTHLAIHGVSSRDITTYDRRLINLSIEITKQSNLKLWDPQRHLHRRHELNLRLAHRAAKLARQAGLSTVSQVLSEIGSSGEIYNFINSKRLR